MKKIIALLLIAGVFNVVSAKDVNREAIKKLDANLAENIIRTNKAYSFAKQNKQDISDLSAKVEIIESKEDDNYMDSENQKKEFNLLKEKYIKISGINKSIQSDYVKVTQKITDLSKLIKKLTDKKTVLNDTPITLKSTPVLKKASKK